MEISNERLKLANIVSLALLQIFIIVVFAVLWVGGVLMAAQIFIIFQVIANIAYLVMP